MGPLYINFNKLMDSIKHINVNGTTYINGTVYESLTASANGTDESLVVTGEKYIWNNKQDAINDLSTIRSGAAAGATAQQPATTLAGYGITDAYTKTEVDNGFVTKETFEQSTTPWYGIRWSRNNPTPVRIGNMELHKTLPI